MPALVLWWCAPSFFILSLALRSLRCLQIWLYFAFLGVFRGFWGCCVGLCCSGAFCGLRGFCARVELGGLKACGVFASVFLRVCLYLSLYLPFVLSLYLLLVLLSFVGLVVFRFPCLSSGFPCGSLCFLFPLRYMRKKKGRTVLVRPLLSCCGCVMGLLYA